MIQRIQTIFLLLAATSTALLFTEPMAFATIFGDAAALKAADQAMLSDGIFEVNDHLILLLLSIMCIVIPLIIIFLYKNRTLQMKLGRATIAVIIMLFALSIILFMKDYSLMSEGTEITIEYGYLAPIFAAAFVILALRFIKKDDKLVKSSDRLR